MNDVILRELKGVVEDAIRPVRATMARKRRIREELLAHVVSVFQQECERGGDQRAALAETKQRFGDSKALSLQLQESVPRWDRCRSILEHMGYQPGESVWHLAGRYFLGMLGIYVVGPLLLLPIVLLLGHHWGLRTCDVNPEVVWICVLALPLINTVLSLALATLVNRLGPVLAGNRWGRLSLTLLCILMLPLALNGAFSGAVLVFVSMVRQATEEHGYREDWA